MKPRLAPLALCLFSVAASAADNGFYLGAGVGQSKFDLENPLDNKDTSYKVIGGIRLLDSFAVELNYADFGKATVPSGIACVAIVGTNCPDTSTVEGQAVSGFAVGFLHFPLVDLFGKVGLSLTNAKLSTPGMPGFGTSKDSTEIAWGGGAQVHFGSLAVRGEYEQFKLFGDEKVEALSVSFIYTFL